MKEHKEKLPVIYLNHDQFFKFYKELHGDLADGEVERRWIQRPKSKIDGVEYVSLTEKPNYFNNKTECDIARKYGYEVIEEVRWIDI